MTPSTNALLPAPSVNEADGDFLRPDMMPLGPTVAIRYGDMRQGDHIALSWEGGPTGDGNWRAERDLTSDNEECSFVIPFSRLLPAETYEVTTRYVVRRSGSDTDEASVDARFTVRNYETLNEVNIYDQHGELLNGPTDGDPTGPIDPDADWFEVGFTEVFDTSLQPGDEVVIWLRGNATSQITTQVEAASAVARMRISDETSRPIRLRFGRRLVVANYGDAFWALCEVVRRSGYVQHEMIGGGENVGTYPENLTPVRTPGLTDDRVILDELEEERGLSVSVWNQSETANSAVSFFIDGSATEAFPGGVGPSVDGWISRPMLEKHADSDCWLYCVATRPNEEGPQALARSPRRLLAVQRSRKPVPFPDVDDSLESPRIDGLTSASLDLPKYPGGPFARVPHGKGFAVGDVVTVIFRTTDGLLAWKASTTIAADHTHEDVVQQVGMAFLSYSQDRYGRLYYSIRSSSGEERFSPLSVIYIGPYIPRIVYYQALWVMNREGSGYLVETRPGDGAQLGLSRQNMRLYTGDRLVLVLQGHRADSSMHIHIAIDEESREWLWIDLPDELLRLNAGYGLTYRATKISGSYIEHTHWKALSILPQVTHDIAPGAAMHTMLPAIFRTASSLSRRFEPVAIIPAIRSTGGQDKV